MKSGGKSIKKIVDYIKGSEHYINEFATWEASEQIIDDNKAFWMLKKPGSQYQKVCLYRDDYNMFVYGDYGQFTFDSMTWTGSVYNLEYDNIGYQMEKLNHESRESLRVFDESKCVDDIFEWMKEQLESYYSLEEDEVEKVLKFFNSDTWDEVDEIEIEEFCDKNDLSEIENIIDFTRECCRNAEEYEWIPFLRSNYNRLYDFGDEACESWLWKAGKCIHQRYFICMYALQVCGEKLLKEKENKKSMPNELKDTIEMMNSENYKERFKAEYYQVVIRYQKLKSMLDKWDNDQLEFTPTCPRSTYNMQIVAMTDYIAVLEARAVMEGVEL